MRFDYNSSSTFEIKIPEKGDLYMYINTVHVKDVHIQGKTILVQVDKINKNTYIILINI